MERRLIVISDIQMAQCSSCKNRAVFQSENGYLCRNHFINYFKHKAYKTIKQYKLINNKDIIAVGYSGGKDSTTLLHLLNSYCKKRNIELFAILIDEGIIGYRDRLIKYAKKFCKEQGIKLHIISFKKEFGYTLDKALLLDKSERPCTLCGIFRRSLLNKASRELKATKLAIGHNMDDEAQTLLLNIFQNKVDLIARGGLDMGVIRNKKFIKRIKPLVFLKEKEIMLYSIIHNFETEHTECPYAINSMRHYIRIHLNQISEKFHHLKSNIIKTELALVASLRKTSDTRDEPLNYCEYCNEPSSGKICNACKILEKLKEFKKRK